MHLKNWTNPAIPVSLKREKCVSTEKETEQFFKAFALEIPEKAVLWFEGPMGVGKSTAIRWMMEAMGVRSLNQGSPSFSLIHEYGEKPGTAHVDLYRIQNLQELQERGILEYLSEWPGRVFIEWGSLFPEKTSLWLKSHDSPQWVIEIQWDRSGSPESRLISIYQRD